MANFFRIKQEDNKTQARTGILAVSCGKVKTPAFVAVGSQAAVKALSPKELKAVGVQIIICNTYHLHLRPGETIVNKQGGLRRFMGWGGPLMTDSGGFQVFSLGKGLEERTGKVGKNTSVKNAPRKKNLLGSGLVKIKENGVTFRSHLDGSRHILTPEGSIKIQRKLGADIIFVLDECTASSDDYEYTKNAMERTHRWAGRSVKEFAKKSTGQFLFGIVQGGSWKSLRRESARVISSMPFDGYGIGGFLGDNKQNMYKNLEWINSLLPKNKPRHLLGIGEPEDILEGVERGVDLFDCITPTRLGRRGTLLTAKGKINIKKSIFLTKKGSAVKNCQCSVCRDFSVGYLCHLFRANEFFAGRLASLHNLYFMANFFQDIRASIESGGFLKFKKSFLKKYQTHI